MKTITLYLILLICGLSSCSVNKHPRHVTLEEDTTEHVFIEVPSETDSFEDIDLDGELPVSSSVRSVRSGNPVISSPSPNQATPIVTSTPKPTLQPNIKVDDEIRMGQISLHIPDTMKVGYTDTVIVRLTRSHTLVITSNMGTTSSKPIRTTSRMEVNIIDIDSAFKIVKNNKTRQLVDTAEYTEWIFYVTPVKSGNRKLNVVVSIVRGEDHKDIVFHDTVSILSNPKKEVAYFWNSNWKWFMSTILIPFIIWLYNRRKKKE